MNNCNLNYNAYAEALKDLIKQDNKYTDYKEVVKLILSFTDVPINQKITSIHAIGKLFANIKSENINSDIANQVLAQSYLLEENNTEDFLKKVSNIVDTKVVTIDTIKDLSEKLFSLNKNQIVEQDIIDLANAILEKGKDNYDKLIEQVKILLAEDTLLLSVWNSKFGIGVKNNPTYIPLDTVIQSNVAWILLKDGTQLYGVLEQGKLHQIFPDGTLGGIINPANIWTIKNPRKTDDRYSTVNGVSVWGDQIMKGNLTLVPLSDVENKDDVVEAKKKIIAGGKYKITAIRLSDNSVERVKAVQKVIPNRKYETFETDEQVNALLEGNSVLTVARPLSTVQQVAFILEIDGVAFSVYGLDNFVFVNPNNTTEEVNFSNDAVLKRLQKLTTKKTSNGHSELTKADLMRLRNSAALYQELKNNAIEALKSSNRADVTDIFNKIYNPTSYKDQVLMDIDTKDERDKTVRADGSVHHYYKLSVPVVQMALRKVVTDEAGAPIITNRYVPIILTKTPTGNYLVENTLQPNEKIYYNNQLIELSSYIAQQKFEDGIRWIDYITNSIKDNDKKFGSNTRSVIVRFNSAKDYSQYPSRVEGEKRNPYQVIERTNESRSTQGSLTILAKLAEVVKNKSVQKNDMITNKLKELFNFLPASSIKSHQTLFNINWSKSFTKDGEVGKLQIAFQPFKGSGERVDVYTEIFQEAKDAKLGYIFNFDIDENSINNLFELLGKQPYIKSLLAKHPELPQDLSNVDNVLLLGKMLNRMDGQETNLVKKRISDFIQSNLLKIFTSSVLDKIEKGKTKENEKAIFDKFVTELKKDYQNAEGETSLEYILFHFLPFAEEYSLNINFNDKNVGFKSYEGYSAYRVVEDLSRNNDKSKGTRTNSNLIFKGKKQEEAPGIEDEVINNAPIVEKIVPETTETGQPVKESTETITIPSSIEEAVNKGKELDSEIDDIDDSPFSISTGSEEYTTIEGIQPEIDFVKDILKDTELVIDDIDAINGNIILGKLKDDIIYLNKKALTKGTLYHEAFHRVFRHSISKEARDKAINEVLNNNEFKAKFTNIALEEFRQQRNKSLLISDNDLKRLIAEEILAEGFAKYQQGKRHTVIKNSFIAKLFALLRNLIRKITGKADIIENLYYKTATGYYRSEQFKEFKDILFDNGVAYEMIQGIREIYKDENGKLKSVITTLPDSNSQNILINYAVAIIASDNTALPFEKKFDNAAKILLDQVFNINIVLSDPDNVKLIQANPELKQQFIDKYGHIYNNYRFMLGARKNELIPDINKSGLEQYDNIIRKNEYDGKDNMFGQVSYEKLRELVKIEYNNIENIADLIDVTDLDRALEDGENPDGLDNANARNESGDNFDKDPSEFNVTKQNVGLVRKFLSMIPQNYIDESLKGIKIKRMVSATETFNMLAKITSNASYDNVIESIKTFAEIIREDGKVNEANDLEAVYKAIFDKNGAIKNEQFYYLLRNILYGVELGYMFFKADTEITTKEEEILGEKVKVKEITTKYNLQDKLLNNDMNSKRQSLYEQFIQSWNNKRNTTEYTEALKNLSDRILEANNAKKNNSYFVELGLTTPDEKLQEAVNYLFDNFKVIGLNIPKSSLKLSLMAIEKRLNPEVKFSDKDENFYKTMNLYVKQNSILTINAFNSLQKSILIKTVDNIKPLLQPDSKRVVEGLQAFDSQFRKLTAVIIKLEPIGLPTIALNAENKPIYRYVRPNPVSLATNKIRQEGIVKYLEEDLFFDDYIKDFVKDDPFIKDLFKDGELTKDARIAIAYARNMINSLYGGVQQSTKDTYKDGQNYRAMHKQTLDLLSITSFMIRNKQTESIGTVDETITLYQKQFDQLESLGTSYLLPAIYTPMVNFNNNKLSYTNELDTNNNKRYLKMTLLLEEKFKQEFNRAKREWLKKEKRLEAYLSGDNLALIKDFNAKWDVNLIDNEIVVTPVINDRNLRAYQISSFLDLIEVSDDAKSIRNFIFEDDIQNYNDIPVEERLKLKDALENYVNSEYQLMEDSLVANEVITIENGIYKSNLLPKTIKTDSTVQKIEEVYGVDNTLKHLVRDAFFNNWANSLNINSLIYGDFGLNIKDRTDHTKRLKKYGAAGPIYGQGWHNVVVVNTIVEFIHEDYPQYGPYSNIQEILNDVIDDTIKEKLVEGFKNQFGKGKYGQMMQKVFDGQSISLIMHMMDGLKTSGRLNDVSTKLLIKKHYSKLTNSEIEYLEKQQAIPNSKKTVTVDKFAYLKLSEAMIDRNEVSLLIDPKTGLVVIDKQLRDRLYSELDVMWKQVYALRNIMDNYQNVEFVKDSLEKIKSITQTIHSYYKAIPGSEKLHTLLNSMEYHQIDQITDTEASKNATILPIDILNMNKEGDYYALNKSQRLLRNDAKYNQVETSGIHEDVSFSVQSKILIPADTFNIEEVIKNQVAESGVPLTSEEQDSLIKVHDYVKEYQKSLKESAEARYNYFTKVMRQDGNFDMGAIYKMMRESFTAQGSPEHMIKLFDTDAEGNPEINPNFAVIRRTLEFYLFSLYSKNITEEKNTGQKFIHESPWGRNIIVDSNNNPVLREDIARYLTPTGELKEGYRSRPLQVTKEVRDGIDHYVIEVMMSKPLFKNSLEEKFWLENITRGIGTRIPTEDKRSMIVFKVVDFLDSSKRNSFVMPYLAHMLAGSDFDVDALYARMLAYYEDDRGTFHVYGQYSSTEKEADEKYLEYLTYLSKQKEFRDSIKNKAKEFKSQEITKDVLDRPEIVSYLTALGYEIDKVKKTYVTDSLETLKSKLIRSKGFMEEITNNEKKYISEKLGLEQSMTDSELKSYLSNKEHLDDVLKGFSDSYYEQFNARNDIEKNIMYKNSIINAISIIDSLNEYNVPSSKENAWYDLVSYVAQNKNVKDSSDIISSAVIFNRLYINQRSSTDAMENALKNGFGIDINTMKVKGNIFSPVYMHQVKANNSGFKDELALAASLNKFLGLAGQYGLELNDKNVIWKYSRNNNGVLESTKYTKYGTLNDKTNYLRDGDDNIIGIEILKNYDRAVEIIGNLLGMFADGAKKPLPGALGFNTISASVVLNMIGIGVPFEFAIAFNFLKDIKKAIETVERQNYAVSEDMKQRNDSFATVLTKMLAVKYEELSAEDKALLPLNEEGQVVSDNLIIDWNRVQLDVDRIRENKVDSVEAGFTVKIQQKGNKVINITPALQEYILLNLYAQQANQSLALTNTNYLTGLFKSFNPDMNSFDRINSAVTSLRAAAMEANNTDEYVPERTIFTNESLQRLFDDQVFNILSDTTQDMDTQFNNIFLERNGIFADLTSLFKGYYTNPKDLAQRVTSYLIIKAFENTHLVEEINKNNENKQYYIADRQNLQRALDPFNVYYEDIKTSLVAMQNKYPNNQFLKLLAVEEKFNDKIQTTTGQEHAKIVRIYAVQQMKNAAFAGNVINDLEALSRSNDFNDKLFVNNIFYRELARTGLQSGVTGSFINLFVNKLKTLSKSLNELDNGLKDISITNNTEALEVLKKVFKLNDNSLATLFDDLVIQMVNGIDFENARVAFQSIIDREDLLKQGFTKEDIDIAIKYILGETKNLSLAGNINLKKFYGSEFVINAEVKNSLGKITILGENENSKLPDTILQLLKVQPSTTSYDKYTFPLLVKFGANMFMLKTLDSTDTTSIGELLISSLKTNTAASLDGYKATYIKINDMSAYTKAVHLSLEQMRALDRVRVNPETGGANNKTDRQAWENSFMIQDAITSTISENDLDITCNIN